MNKDKLNALLELPTHQQGEIIGAILDECINGDGLDGIALDIVIHVIHNLGEISTDEESLDLVGRIVDQWRVAVKYY